MARVYRETGKYDPGVQCTQQAFQLEPDYPAALFELARIRIEQRKNAEAVALLRSRLAKGPDLPSLYWLAFAQEQQGDSTAWAAFEKSARAVQGAPGNADTLLIRYLAAHGHAGDALTLARNALKSHHDLFTLQADAVALEKAGQPLEALQQIRKALEPGLLDASLYVDAGRIAAEANDRKAAAAYFRKAFELGSNGFYSAEILKMLSSMSDTDSN
jgi:tetratricopeptide (TPR) repeat protein